MDFGELARQAAQDLYDGTAVIFLGAGASMGEDQERASNRGIPSSGELTQATANQFGINLKEDSTLRGVCSLAARERDESTVKRFVLDQLRPRCGTPLKAHRALARVCPQLIMTTNYDDLYEAALREAGTPVEKVVRASQLPRLPHGRPRILKLHGDLENPEEIVLTGPDYRRWRSRAGGLKAEVVAALQKSVCVFVGYSVGDENLRDILNIIEENQGASSLKHFALVRDVDHEMAAEWEGIVEFVQGDATSFFECLAGEYETLGPRPLDPALERTNFERHLQSGDLRSAGEACGRLADHLKQRGECAGAGSLWQAFGEAAQNTDEHGLAAAALKHAGELFLKAGYSLDAEPILSAALSEAKTAEEPAVEREIQPLLQKARLSTGKYDDVLRDTKQALTTYNAAAPSLTYALRGARAEAREATEGLDGALEELNTGFSELPADALYFRARVGADISRLFSEKFEWDSARDILNTVSTEISTNCSHDRDEIKRCEAILKLARANIHFAVGEDTEAATLYQECAPVLEEFGETGFAVSALQGAVACTPLLGYLAGKDTTVHLRDLAKSSVEHRRVKELQRQGIEYLADDKLAVARNSLVQAELAASSVHSSVRVRSVQDWMGDVLLKAGFAKEALLQYAKAGKRKKVKEVARNVREEMPPRENGSLPSVERLIELATNGPLHSRGAAFVGLTQLWDILPEGSLPELAEQLALLPEMRGSGWADRNALPDAAELALALAPRFTEWQAGGIVIAAVSVIEKDVRWTSHKSACLALTSLVRVHTGIIGRLEVPTERLAELVDGDVLNDTVKALMTLVNLGLSGHTESREKALELVDGADTFSRVSWRHVLGEASDEELASATRLLLPQSISRVRREQDSTTLGLGAITPMFLKEWNLPVSVRSDVANSLADAIVDPAAALTHRQAAALILGLKAEQFDDKDCRKIIDSLRTVITQPFDAHSMTMSISNPLSMLKSNMGEPEDVISAATEALLAFSRRIDDEQERWLLRREIEKLRASQAGTLARGVAVGLANFAPKNEDEERWQRTRLLLLLNSHHARVREGAARSLAALVERGNVAFDAELLDTAVELAVSEHVADRAAAAFALSKMANTTAWNHNSVTESLENLYCDASFVVRHEAIPGR